MCSLLFDFAGAEHCPITEKSSQGYCDGKRCRSCCSGMCNPNISEVSHGRVLCLCFFSSPINSYFRAGGFVSTASHIKEKTERSRRRAVPCKAVVFMITSVGIFSFSAYYASCNRLRRMRLHWEQKWIRYYSNQWVIL